MAAHYAAEHATLHIARKPQLEPDKYTFAFKTISPTLERDG